MSHGGLEPSEETSTPFLEVARTYLKMPEFTQKEHLQPSLLDRLTDDELVKKVDSLGQRVLSFQKFRQSVIRDLGWLLNTGRLESTQDLSGYPHARQSVLNFGIPDLTGTTASSLDDPTLERVLRQAILDFEPRILPNSLKVSVEKKDRGKHNSIVFKIQGELWWQPMPERLYLKTILDLELGNVEVKVEG